MASRNGQGIRISNQYCFAANGQTGSGAAQTIKHGLSRTPDLVWAQSYGATLGADVTAMTWDKDNITITVANGVTYQVKAEIF